VAPDSPSWESEDPEATPSIPAASVAAQAGSIPADAPDREIWSLSWPVILSQLLASAISLIDIAMLSRLGSDALAAVGYVTQVFWLAQAGLMAIGVAGVALISQALGSGRPARARATFVSSIAVSVVLAATVCGAAGSAPLTLLGWLNATPKISALALPYLHLTLLASVLFAVSISYESGFRAARDTRTPLWIAGGVTVVKIGLNYLLIFQPWQFGLVGAGFATLGAQALAITALIVASRRGAAAEALAFRADDVRRAPSLLPELIRVAWPAVIERILLNIAVMAYFVVLGHYGPATVAAYTVGVRILSFSWIPATSFSAASAAIVGHAIGAGDVAAARIAGWRSMRIALVVATALGVVFALIRKPLAAAFTDDPAVLAGLDSFMLIVALAQPFVGIHFTLAGALRGAGATLWPLLSAFFGNWCVRVPMVWTLGYALHWDVMWLWIAMVTDHIVRTGWMLVVFRSGVWVPVALRQPRPKASSIAC
jgi:putative MATE family efflux protein